MQGRTEGFVIEGAERYSIVGIRAHPSCQWRDFLGGSGGMLSRKIFEIDVL